jgi:hypothetical protein
VERRLRRRPFALVGGSYTSPGNHSGLPGEASGELASGGTGKPRTPPTNSVMALRVPRGDRDVCLSCIHAEEKV